jgi:hypothetical protein
MSDISDKLAALREAWLDTPFEGVTDKGNGFWIQTLLNAVSDIVDPDRTLRETAEAQRRGRLASYRSKANHAREQVRLCIENQMHEHAAEWTAKLNEHVTACLSEFGVEP